MTKKELVASIAENNDMAQKDVTLVMDACFDTIKDALAEEEKITIFGFGTFTPKVRPARQGRNPATGKAIDIPETNVVSFKPAAGLKSHLNQ